MAKLIFSIRKSISFMCSIVIFLFFSAALAIAQTTAFTYQGKLVDNGNLANISYDMQFKLFDALSGGTQIGSTLTFNGTGTNPPAVSVTNGTFAVTLDFNPPPPPASPCPTCFDGSPRFLEIAVKPHGSGSYTTLTPRQSITATPYAIKTQNLTFNGPFNDGLVPPTVFTASNTFAGDSAGLNTAPHPNPVLSSGKFNSFYGAGAGQANTTGRFNTFFGSQSGQNNIDGFSNAFFGYFAGRANIFGDNNAFFGTAAGSSNTNASFNAFFGNGAGRSNTTGQQNTFIGNNADFNVTNPTGDNNTLLGASSRVTSDINNATAIGAQASVTQSDSLVLGSIAGVNGCAFGCTTVNVGIGTTAPSERLHVVGNGLFTGNLTVNGTLYAGSIAASSVTGVVATANGGTGLNSSGAAGNYLRSNGTGWTTSALQAGDLTGTLGTLNGGTGLSNSGVAGTYLRSNGSTWTSAAIQAADLPSGSTNYIQNRIEGQSGNFNIFGSGVIGENFFVGNNVTVYGTVTTGGSVGIGTNAPFYKLEIEDATNFGLRVQTNTGGGAVASFGGNGDFLIDANGIEGGRFIVKESGNVGIGTPAPAAKLDVSGTGVIRARVDSDSNAGLALTLGNQPKWSVATVTGGNFQIYNDALISNALLINSANNFVGIGTTFPDQLLTVNGNASKVGGGSWATFSDERLKNIHGSYTRGLNALMQLQPIRFEYKADNALGLRGMGESIGFSAQEVQRILPEAVTRSTSGYLQLNNDPILWTMLNAVKEQQAQLVSQQAQLKQQAEQMQNQQREIEGLKRLVCLQRPTAEICKARTRTDSATQKLRSTNHKR